MIWKRRRGGFVGWKAGEAVKSFPGEFGSGMLRGFR